MIIDLHLPHGQTQHIQAVGRYLMLKEGKRVTAIVGDAALTMPRGYVFDLGDTFTQLTLTNEGDDPEIELLTSVIPFTSGLDANVMTAFDGAQPVYFAEPPEVRLTEGARRQTGFIAHDTLTQSTTLSGNSNRKELLLQASPTNTDTLWLGGVAERGYGLEPGAGMVLNITKPLDVLIPSNNKLFVSEVVA
ncbi:hypothetical protein [Enterovibrio coralii]|uniref:Uncharacterized protein n=1 Tax=Enterovibrio coralii TaxID=294935 RepID=A0A135I708_9GAMM|nr:hypothetical protein [Enterovibrio coralii]KXF81197.1 hypothetical protein ATN88_00030 [Enterovibrio coralii]